MKLFFSLILFFSAAGLFCAPIEGSFSVSPAEMRQRVINAAAKYENTPYVYGGMSSRGLDCSGFIGLSFRDALGASLPRSTIALYTWVEKITLDNTQPGDLLFFKTDNSGNITHVALYLGNGRFIHSASAGDRTGVIYSSLNEPYWSRAYAGAGRVLPVAAERAYNPNGSTQGAPVNTEAQRGSGALSSSNASTSRNKGGLLIGFGFAPTWNFVFNEELFRGFASHFHFGTDTYLFGPRVIFGLELRPEYDGALGIFRIPVTLSFGLNDRFTVFGGPVLSIGTPSLSINNDERHYKGGANWFGAAGLAITPFIHKTSAGEFAPFLEAAWQYYPHETDDTVFFADLRANTRFSTGIRWAMRIK